MKKSMKFHALAAACALLSAQSVLANISENASISIIANNDDNGDGEGLTLKSNAAGAAGATFITNGNTTIWGNSSTTVQSNANVSIVGNNDNTGSGEGVRILSQGDADNVNGAYINVLDKTIKLQSGSENGTINLTSTSNTISASTNTVIKGVFDANSTDTASVEVNGGNSNYPGVYIKGTNGVNINAGGTTGAVSIGNGNAVNTINGSNNTMTTATGTNTLSAVANKLTATSNFGTNTISAMGTSGANTMEAAVANTITSNGDNNMLAVSGANNLTAGANNITATNANTISGASNSMTATAGANTISAGTINDITGGTGNDIRATTGNNSMEAAAGANTITAHTLNSIQGPVNYIGTDFASSNTIGNAMPTTNVTAQGGNAGMLLQQDLAGMGVTQGTSGLATRTDADGNAVANSATRATVSLTNTAGASVDANGKLTDAQANEANGTVIDAPTAALTLTNGYGNTHGIVVTESQTTISGGTQSSSMTLADNGATFSNAETGAPVQVHGVADGTADFDAINVRQFAGAIAAVTAQANIPSLAAGQDKTIGVGLGHFMGKTGLAVGMNLRGKKNGIYKLSVSTGLNGGAKFVVGGGAAWSF